MANFFGKVREGDGRGAATASAMSKELQESARIKVQIKGLKDKRKALVEELGKIIYAMFLKNGFDREKVKARCAAIALLDNQIKEKEKELQEVHREAQEALGQPKSLNVCQCGEPAYEGTKLCGKCGRNMEPA